MCELSEFSTMEAPVYDAISYFWGKSRPRNISSVMDNNHPLHPMTTNSSTAYKSTESG